MDDTFQADSSSDDRLQGCSAAIRNDLRVYPAFSFKETKNNGFRASAPASKALDSARPKIAFINFHFTGNRRLSLTKLGYPLPDGHEIPIDGVAV